MKRFLWIIITIGLFVQKSNSQIDEISIERAMSLSRMADFYNTSHNYEKAIDQEKKALEMKGKLYGKHSLEYATSAFNFNIIITEE